MPRQALPAAISASLVGLAGLPVLGLIDLGPLSAHMALHILLMNVVAPLAAAFLVRSEADVPRRARLLWAAAGLQLAVLWAWHAPPLQDAGAHSAVLQLLLHGLLAACATAFWVLLLDSPKASRWQAILALLLTGKLSCLLGVLLIFSPRLLYAHGHSPPSLEDQQLAGLLMVTACPLSYVAAAVVLSAQLLADLRKSGGRTAADAA